MFYRTKKIQKGALFTFYDQNCVTISEKIWEKFSGEM